MTPDITKNADLGQSKCKFNFLNFVNFSKSSIKFLQKACLKELRTLIYAEGKKKAKHEVTLLCKVTSSLTFKSENPIFTKTLLLTLKFLLHFHI